MRFRLRTLLIVLALGPPVLAGGWYAWPKQRPHFMTRMAWADIFMLRSAVNMYAQNVGAQPPDLQALWIPPPDLEAPHKWAGPYLEVPGDLIDPWGNPYLYNSQTSGFRIWSAGPDGVSPSKDDI